MIQWVEDEAHPGRDTDPAVEDYRWDVNQVTKAACVGGSCQTENALLEQRVSVAERDSVQLRDAARTPACHEVSVPLGADGSQVIHLADGVRGVPLEIFRE